MNQLPLPFSIPEGRTFGNYVVGDNSKLVVRLTQAGDGPPVLWLWGRRSAGKSHLAQATCHWHVDRGAKVAYVPFSALPQDPEVLRGLAVYDLVVLDDLQDWLGQSCLERALLGLHEELMLRRSRLLVLADQPAARCRFALPDLGSRLKAAPTEQVEVLDDQGKGLVLASQARRRGLDMPPRVLNYWLGRSERRLSYLLNDFERLDQAALSEQRRLTIPLVKKVLGL